LRSLTSRAVHIAEGKADTPAGAVHLNFAFADPLPPIPVAEDVPDDLTTHPNAWYGRSPQESYSQIAVGRKVLSTDAIATLATQMTSRPRGVIVVGVQADLPDFAPAVQRLAQVTGYPLLAESTGLDRWGTISHYDSFLRSPHFSQTHAPDILIRFGAMPTSKSFQLWLERHIHCQQIVVGGYNNDPTHGLTQSLNVHPTFFCEQLSNYLKDYTLPTWQDPQWRRDFERAESVATGAIADFLASIESLFEGKVFAELGNWLPAHTQLYIANSMPIRDLDTFFHNQQPITVLANRGANGIDGTLSCALGAAWGSDLPTVLACGDLAFYHDLNGLMAVKQYAVNLTVILLNNDGGGIFDLLPVSQFDPPFTELFATAHGLDFEPIVSAYGCDYMRIHDWQHFRECVMHSLQQPGTQILEVRCDRQPSRDLHRTLWQQVSDAVDRHFTDV
jgi:2-succinyl-5-enolpyruvyl-6-hydroxy-3-cyclohexene-1-carboxylate synthase